jgi:catechol 2,3-dioxygenase-like lactoylglutathione lyase family enzyme
MIRSLSHISLSSSNLDKVKKFYIDILKFKIVHKFINPKTNFEYGIFIFCGNNTLLEFFYDKEKTKKKRGAIFRHICFEVKNIYSFKKKIQKKFKKKITIGRGKTDGVLKFWLRDFENNPVEFHSYDKISKLNRIGNMSTQDFMLKEYKKFKRK